MKKLNLTLVGLDGNAFSILAAFRRQAFKEGWSDQEVTDVAEDAMNGDYDHLLSVIQSRCANAGFGSEE